MVGTLLATTGVFLGSFSCINHIEAFGKIIITKAPLAGTYIVKNLTRGRWQEVGGRESVHRSFIDVDKVPRALGVCAEGHDDSKKLNTKIGQEAAILGFRLRAVSQC
jgi:hypothetical protein